MIDAALTPEEWAELQSTGPSLPSVLGDDSRLHAVAASCLYGQPFGFTWEDVDRLRWGVIAMLRQWNVTLGDDSSIHSLTSQDVAEHDQSAAVVWDVSDRIAALLPPREAS